MTKRKGERGIAQLISKDLSHVVFCTHRSSDYIIHKLKCSLIKKLGHLRTQQLSLCLNGLSEQPNLRETSLKVVDGSIDCPVGLLGGVLVPLSSQAILKSVLGKLSM